MLATDNQERAQEDLEVQQTQRHVREQWEKDRALDPWRKEGMLANWNALATGGMLMRDFADPRVHQFGQASPEAARIFMPDPYNGRIKQDIRTSANITINARTDRPDELAREMEKGYGRAVRDAKAVFSEEVE